MYQQKERYQMNPIPANRRRVGYAEEQTTAPGRQPKKKGEEGRPREYRKAKQITNQCVSKDLAIMAAAEDPYLYVEPVEERLTTENKEWIEEDI